MKAKTAFESGNSPPKVSESGAPLLTGRGLQTVEERIRKAFEHVHGGRPAPEKQPLVYTEVHAERFHQKAKALTKSALTIQMLSASRISKRRDVVCWEIAVPTESAEELIREALGE